MDEETTKEALDDLEDFLIGKMEKMKKEFNEELTQIKSENAINIKQITNKIQQMDSDNQIIFTQIKDAFPTFNYIDQQLKPIEKSLQHFEKKFNFLNVKQYEADLNTIYDQIDALSKQNIKVKDTTKLNKSVQKDIVTKISEGKKNTEIEFQHIWEHVKKFADYSDIKKLRDETGKKNLEIEVEIEELRSKLKDIADFPLSPRGSQARLEKGNSKGLLKNKSELLGVENVDEYRELIGIQNEKIIGFELMLNAFNKEINQDIEEAVKKACKYQISTTGEGKNILNSEEIKLLFSQKADKSDIIMVNDQKSNKQDVFTMSTQIEEMHTQIAYVATIVTELLRISMLPLSEPQTSKQHKKMGLYNQLILLCKWLGEGGNKSQASGLSYKDNNQGTMETQTSKQKLVDNRKSRYLGEHANTANNSPMAPRPPPENPTTGVQSVQPLLRKLRGNNIKIRDYSRGSKTGSEGIGYKTRVKQGGRLLLRGAHDNTNTKLEFSQSTTLSPRSSTFRGGKGEGNNSHLTTRFPTLARSSHGSVVSSGINRYMGAYEGKNVKMLNLSADESRGQQVVRK